MDTTPNPFVTDRRWYDHQVFKITVPIIGGVLLVFVVCCYFLVFRRSHTRFLSFILYWSGGHRTCRIGSAAPAIDRVSHRSNMGSMLELSEALNINDILKNDIKHILIDRKSLDIGNLIGQGEFGYVKRATLTTRDGHYLQVVVKTKKDKYTIEHLLEEGVFSSNLQHENILQVIGICIDKTPDREFVEPLVVMPFMKHGDLRTYLLKERKGEGIKKYSITQLIGFTLQIALGMSYLSSKQCIHGYLAAKKCMLDGEINNFVVKIADFGQNYRIEEFTILPLKWMSPEVLMFSRYTEKSDVWAFGVTVWEIFTFGQHPYSCMHCDLVEYICRGNRLMRPASTCPHEMWVLMQDCWKENPSGRPTFESITERLERIQTSNKCAT